MYGLWASSISSIWKLLRNVVSWVHSQISADSKSVGMEPNKLSRGF